jgi:hypothetical protein
MRRPLIGTLVIAALIATACGSDETSQDVETTTDEVVVEADEVAAGDDAAEVVVEDTSSEPAEGVGPHDGAPEAFAANPAGEYSFGFGGGQLTVSAPAEFFFADLGNAVFFDDPAEAGGGSDYYGFLQPSVLPTDNGSAEATDPETWIAQNSSLTLEMRDVGDPRWQIYRLTTDSTIALADNVDLKPNELYELWFVLVDAPDPLVVMGKTVPSTPEMLDVLPQVAESITFAPPPGNQDEQETESAGQAECGDRPWECGEPGMAPAGVKICVPALAGIGFTMSEERIVVQPNPWFLLVDDFGFWDGEQNPSAVVIKPSQTVDGEPITTAEQVFELQSAAMELTPIESRTFFGIEVEGYAFVGDVLEPELFSVVTPDEQEQGITLEDGYVSPPPFGEVWFVDTADGPILVSAAAWLAEEVPAARAVLDDIGPTLELQPRACP